MLKMSPFPLLLHFNNSKPFLLLYNTQKLKQGIESVNNYGK